MRILFSVLFITLLFAFLCPYSNSLKINSENTATLASSTKSQLKAESQIISDEDANTILGLQKTLDEFNLGVDNLIAKFNDHNALYDTWILAAKTDEEKNGILRNEKSNLDSYVTLATGLYTMIKSIKDDLKKYDTNDSVSDSVANEGTETLIQLFAKRYEELGFKMDTKASALLQKNTKSRKSFLKK